MPAFAPRQTGMHLVGRERHPGPMAVLSGMGVMGLVVVRHGGELMGILPTGIPVMVWDAPPLVSVAHLEPRQAPEHDEGYQQQFQGTVQ